MLQHERDEEGEEYADKEKFVTTAYKRQMEEVKLAEEEEKAREGASIPYKDSRVIARVLTDSSCISVLAAKERASQKGPGMTAFYRNMLDADEEKALRPLFEKFLPVNHRLRDICTAWQLRPDGSLEGFEGAGRNQDAEPGVAVLGHLIAMLVIFINEPLTLHLVRDAWPDAPLDESDLRGEGQS